MWPGLGYYLWWNISVLRWRMRSLGEGHLQNDDLSTWPKLHCVLHIWRCVESLWRWPATSMFTHKIWCELCTSWWVLLLCYRTIRSEGFLSLFSHRSLSTPILCLSTLCGSHLLHSRGQWSDYNWYLLGKYFCLTFQRRTGFKIDSDSRRIWQCNKFRSWFNIYLGSKMSVGRYNI